MSALRERMIREMQVRRGALAMQKAYVRAIPPRKMLCYAASIALAEKILRLGVQALSTDELLAAVLAEKAAMEVAALAEGRLRTPRALPSVHRPRLGVVAGLCRLRRNRRPHNNFEDRNPA